MIRSNLEGLTFYFYIYGVFEGGSEVVSEFVCRSCVRWIDSHPTYSGLSTLFAGSDILEDIRSALVVKSLTFRPLTWWRFLWALDPKLLPDSLVFLKFSDGLLRNFREVFFLPYVVIVSR